jgi:hypothetical protein
MPGANPVEDLVRVGLFRPDDSDPHRPGYWVRSWAKWNGTADEISAKKDAQKEKDRERQRAWREREKAKKNVTDSSQRDVTDGHEATNGESRTSSSNSSSAATPAAAAPGEPPLPELTPEQTAALADLRKRITAAGLEVSWQLNAEELGRLLAVLERCGPKALVNHAKRRHRPNDPAIFAKAWLEGWEQLPALVEVQAQTEPCLLHQQPDRDHCSGCAADRKASSS